MSPLPRPAVPSAARTIERRAGRFGELALRRCGEDYEIISNGVFLSDTRDGRSARLLVHAALEARHAAREAGHPTSGRRVLIGGLGVGFSLAEALTHPDVSRVVVVEVEAAVVRWNSSFTGARSGGRVDDPRVRCDIADLVEWLRSAPPETFDAVCLDVDNGPDWTVGPGNRWLYADEGLTALRDRLTDGGVLSLWSTADLPVFTARLGRRFREVRRLEIPVARGEPDVVYLADR